MVQSTNPLQDWNDVLWVSYFYYCIHQLTAGSHVRHVLILYVYAFIYCIKVLSNAISDGIAASTLGSFMNYILLGIGSSVDQFYLHSFEIFLACVVVFTGVGNVGFTLLEYRLGQRSLLGATFENLRWVPFLYAF